MFERIISYPFPADLARSHQTLKSEVEVGELSGLLLAFFFSYGAFYLKIFTSGETFFRLDLVMEKILRQFSPFRWFKKGSFQLLAKECALSTGKLPRRLAQGQWG